MNWITPNKKHTFISGPCSAETEGQVIETALRLKNTGCVDVFRAGIWKPRTRPGSFEGIGEIGLSWLKTVKEETGLPVMVEVARASHVEMCLRQGIDIMWIGARTTANPFAVQEIADALKGIDQPILLKNPINPDLNLWLGGMERLLKAGLTHIGAIHRGFSFTGEKIYRNRPQWQIAIDFKTEMPDVLMICDPSHICGNRTMLQQVAQKALDLNFDGLMIESHITPDKAWSDAEQQVTPEAYAAMIDNLVFRDPQAAQSGIDPILEHFRGQIDLIDEEIVSILASRMQVVQAIGNYKKDKRMTILQAERWKEIFQKYVDSARQYGLGIEFITDIVKAIHNESIDQQERILSASNKKISSTTKK